MKKYFLTLLLCSFAVASCTPAMMDKFASQPEKDIVSQPITGPDPIMVSEKKQALPGQVLINKQKGLSTIDDTVQPDSKVIPSIQSDMTVSNTLATLKDKLIRLRDRIAQTELSLLEMKDLVNEMEQWQSRLQRSVDAVPVEPVLQKDISAPISLGQKQGTQKVVSFDALKIVRNIDGTPKKQAEEPVAQLSPRQTVKAARIGQSAGKVRMVLDFSGKPDIKYSVMKQPKQIVIKLPATRWDARLSQVLNQSAIMRSYTAKIIDEKTQTVQLTVNLAPNARLDRFFVLTDRNPYRLVIDIVK